MEEVRVEPRGAPGDGVDGARERRHAEMLAWGRAGNDRPAPRRRSNESAFRASRWAPLVTPPATTILPPRRRRRPRRAETASEEVPPARRFSRTSTVRSGVPSTVSRRGRTGARPPDRHRVVNADREIRQPSPAVRAGEYASTRVDAPSVEREAAERRRSRCRPRLRRPRCAAAGSAARVSQARRRRKSDVERERAPTRATRRGKRTTPAPTQAGSTTSVRPSTRERRPSCRRRSRPRSGRARSRPPTFTWPSGQRSVDGDSRSCRRASRPPRLSALRPPEEEPGLDDVEHAADDDRHEPPRRGQDEDREERGRSGRARGGYSAGRGLAAARLPAPTPRRVSSARARGGASGDTAGS